MPLYEADSLQFTLVPTTIVTLAPPQAHGLFLLSDQIP